MEETKMHTEFEEELYERLMVEMIILKCISRHKFF
jgi:hypothetical protein